MYKIRDKYDCKNTNDDASLILLGMSIVNLAFGIVVQRA